MSTIGLFTPCPVCGYHTDTHDAIGPEPAVPHTGDAAICLRCGQLLLWTLDFVGLRFRIPTEAETHELRGDLRVAAWVTAFRRQPCVEVAAA